MTRTQRRQQKENGKKNKKGFIKFFGWMLTVLGAGIGAFLVAMFKVLGSEAGTALVELFHLIN
ncbi:hypothetical protein [Priestia megaterium]|uniref:hypothetical protein n=1 Tax=Priestia megaterium TaxID=1404 RepID=UPI002FFFA872